LKIFYGRPDGLGNRIEELIQLSSFAVENKIQIKYFWNNSKNFKYPCRVSVKNIHIEEIQTLKNWPTKNFESSNEWRKYISQYNYIYKDQIKFDFTLPKISSEFIAIHVRGKDRIISPERASYLKFDGFSDLSTLDFCAKKTVEYLDSINNSDPLLVLGDDEKFVKSLKKMLKKSEILNIDYQNKDVENEYIDFYYLINSKKIIMSSLFSSYAITAAILGSIPLVTFFDESQTTISNFSVKLEKYGIQDSKKTITLNKNFKEFELNSLIKLGSRKSEEFVVSKTLVNNSGILISDNNSRHYFFEEHFKITNKDASIIFAGQSLIKKMFTEINKILFNEKNRRIKLIRYINEVFKTIKIFNKDSFKIFNSRNLDSSRKKFIFTTIDNKNLNFYINMNDMVSLIVCFEEIDLDSTIFNSVLNNPRLKLIYKSFSKISNNKASGYLSFVNSKNYEYSNTRNPNFFEADKKFKILYNS